MAENESVAQTGITREQVSLIARDPELRKLRPNTPEYKAAFEKKFSNGSTKTPAPAAEVKDEKVETKEVSGQTEASDEGVEADDKALTVKAQKRISKLLAERKAEATLRAKLEARVAELETAGKTPKQAEKQAAAEVQQTTEYTKAKPKLSDFTNYNDYTEALTDWKLDKRDWEVEQKSKVKANQESQKSVMDKFWSEGSKLEKEMGLDEGDFSTLIENDGVKKYPPTVTAILDSPFGPQIAFELANLDETEKERFNKMTDIKQISYIGRLEAKFESKKQQQKETPTISAAKAPGKPLKKGTGAVTTPIRTGMSSSEYRAARKAAHPEKFWR